MRKLNTIITSFLIVICLILGVNSVKAAGFSGSINEASFDNYSFNLLNNTSISKDSIYTIIDNYLTSYNNTNIKDYQYIFIGFPTSPQASSGDVRHYIYIDLIPDNYVITSFVYNSSYADMYPTSFNGIVHLKIDISTCVISADSYTDYACSACRRGWNASNNTYIVYTNFDINTSMITSPSLTAYTQYRKDFEMIQNIPFSIDFEQGEVILKNSSGAIANLVTYYLEPNFDLFTPDDYIFTYFENGGGGTRDSYQFNLTYVENGISYNGKTYHYYYNLPLSYNIGLTFSIYDLEDNLLQRNEFTAYLSSLTSLTGFTMYDFRNYEFADMSDIDTGSFGLSYQLNTNITINAINYNTDSKIDFLTSNYLINSHTDNNGVTWYDFDFNNEPIYLEFVNNFNNTNDFYTFIDTYDLYLYFDNDAFIHLSGSPSSIETQDDIVNQSAYKDNQGNIIYNNNPVVINIDNSNEFFENFQKYFEDFNNNTFGLTGIITSPLNLIQNLLTNTCNSLVVPIPYINSNLTLPCMSTIYSQYFGVFYTFYQNITFGIVAYWVIVRIFNMVKDFRNPEHDEIEVLDL